MTEFLNKLTAGVTANRLLTFSTSLASLGTTLAALAGAFPVGQTQATIIAASGLLAALGNTLHFQRGAQVYDSYTPPPYVTDQKPTFGENGADLAFIDDGVPDIDPHDLAKLPPDVEQDVGKVAV